MKKTKGVVDCVSFLLVKDNAFLAEKRAMTKKVDPGAITIPGGHVEENETPEQTVEREVQEELNVKPIGYEWLCTLMYNNPEEKQRAHYFLIDKWIGTIEAKEADKLTWLNFKDRNKINVSVDRKAIEIYLEKTTKTRFKNWEEKYQQHGAVQTRPMQIVQEAVAVLRKRKDKKILDLACGTGRHTLFLAEKGFHVTGTDISETALRIVRKEMKKRRIKNIRVCIGDMHKIPFKKESFDAVVCTRAIYHGKRKQIQKAIAEIHRVLRPKGLFLFNALTTNHPDYRNGKRIEKNTFVHVHQSEYLVPHHFFSKEETLALLKRFRILQFKPMHYSDLPGNKPNEFEIIAEKR